MFRFYAQYSAYASLRAHFSTIPYCNATVEVIKYI